MLANKLSKFIFEPDLNENTNYLKVFANNNHEIYNLNIWFNPEEILAQKNTTQEFIKFIIDAAPAQYKQIVDKRIFNEYINPIPMIILYSEEIYGPYKLIPYSNNNTLINFDSEYEDRLIDLINLYFV